MRIRHIVLIVALTGQGVTGSAQAPRTMPASPERQLSGLDTAGATALLAKLETAQRKLKAGEFQSFDLLAGSIASYDKTKVSPRDAFLQIPFRAVWSIERVKSDNSLWQPYRLTYFPEGLGKLYWQIEVVLNINGDLQRVLMIYRPPAPF